MTDAQEKPAHFIRQIIDKDLQQGLNEGRVHTRFPPEPNGYLHIGHAKSICLNFGLAQDHAGGLCNLRFDDTNPHKENEDYVRAIKEDVAWLGYSWEDRLYFASDYFEQLYGFAIELIEKGLAYVCDLSPDEAREHRGTLTEPGRNSPYRERGVEENLDLFKRMRAGEFADGSRVLRAKIDMASPNINMRDPMLYRIRHGVIHHQTGSEWCIYPMYDFTHPLSDALECITHSLCTLEFQDHRPFYDWVVEHTSVPCTPRQYEFARLNLQYTVVSKRKLTQLVDEGHVADWDDPRMPTIAGLRRRGYTPASIREFADRIGVTKADNSVEMGMLEACIREDLDRNAPRAMAVLRPLKVTIESWAEGHKETIEAPNHPQRPELGSRELVMTREVWIDREDFLEVAPNKKFKRLVSGGEVRLRNAYVIKCEQVIKDEQGEIIELRCSHDAATLGAQPEGRKVKGVIHWVSAEHSVAAELRLYDRLFNHANPDGDRSVESFLAHLNPDSLNRLETCRVEAFLDQVEAGSRFQFEREGYFCKDADSQPGRPVFNLTVALRDSWGKQQGKG